jgi:hypothetical protein
VIARRSRTPENCQAELALYQIAFTVGPERQGVVDPVTAEVPINGLGYRVLGSNDPRPTLFADCTLILSLARAAAIMRARDIVEVADLGVYNFRCIGGGTPPDCPNGISQHAFATAIDIAGVTDRNGEFFSVNDDWIIDPDTEDTCATPSEPGKDQFLHDLICELKAASTWNIVLTPNYNDAHRNHFHVDLTPDSDFIEKRQFESDRDRLRAAEGRRTRLSSVTGLWSTTVRPASRPAWCAPVIATLVRRVVMCGCRLR